MIKPVIKRGDPRLHEISEEITDFSQVQNLITDLWDTLGAIQKLYTFTRGSGLGAPQIGTLLRVSVVEFEGKRFTLINPNLYGHSEDKQLISEGCLSYFDWRGKALRYKDVTVRAFDEQGKAFTVSSNGDPDLSSLLQHELDHLDGKLYVSAMPQGEQLEYRAGLPKIP